MENMPAGTAETGLPQGSVLSPLLFLLYINPLKTVVPNGVEVAMFAGDVSLFCTNHLKTVVPNGVEVAMFAGVVSLFGIHSCRSMQLVHLV